ncbi:MAG: DNA polymerase III subunit delta' [Fimbriimonadaceae bacterium]|nr:DNA polymerase III subunit delta' [Alphaproteobacteria bacterium]
MAQATRKAASTASDAIPEADCRDFAVHPRANLQLFGHETAENVVLEAIRSGRMHHAWLIQGPTGIGKATLAYRIARFLLSQRNPEAATSLDADEDNVAVRQIMAHAHPDLFVLRREWAKDRKKLRQTIAVDDVRQTIGFFNHTSAVGGWRVAIVDTMDDLNRNGANALLKTLEEPPERALFLLVSSSPGVLPATIRSRCRRLVLTALNDKDMTSALSVGSTNDILSGLNTDDKKSLFVLADGSPGQAIELASGNGLKINREIEGILANLPVLDYARLHALAAGLGRAGKENDFSLCLRLLKGWITSKVVSGAGGKEIPEPAALAMAWERISQLHGTAVALNLDRQRALLDAFNIVAVHYRR